MSDFRHSVGAKNSETYMPVYYSCPHGRAAQIGIGSKCEICSLAAENNSKIGQLEAEIAELRQRAERAEAAMWWRPIATAPRDGTFVLTRNPYGQVCQDFADSNSSEMICQSWSGNPTHWMPLPPPPATAGTGEGE